MASLAGVALSSSEEVLAVCVADLERLLLARPIDEGLCRARLVELAAAVRRLGDAAAHTYVARRPGVLVDCPLCLVNVVPTMLNFLRYCHSRDRGALRLVENLVANLVFQVTVWVRGLLPSLVETLSANLSFLVHAARLQLAAMKTGSVEIHGLPPLAHSIMSEVTLTTHDDYVWLATVALTKLDSSHLTTWLQHGVKAPQSEAFLRVTHAAAVAVLLFATLRLHESVFRAIMLEPRSPTYPIPALLRKPPVMLPKQRAVMHQGFRVFFIRSLHTAATIVHAGRLPATAWLDALRLLVCGVHTHLLAELLQISDNPAGHRGPLSPSSSFTASMELEGDSTLARNESMSPLRGVNSVVSPYAIADGESGATQDQPPPGSLLLMHECIAELGSALLASDENRRMTEATATQLVKVAVLLASAEGLRQNARKGPARSLVRLARDFLAASRYVESSALVESVTTAHAEVLHLHAAAEARYSMCQASLHESFTHCVDLYVSAHTPLQSDLGTGLTGLHTQLQLRSGYSGAIASTLSPRDEAWRSILRAAMLLAEASASSSASASPQGARGASSGAAPAPVPARATLAWWQLTMQYVRLAAQHDDAQSRPPAGRTIPSAKSVLGTESTWSGYDDWCAERCLRLDSIAAAEAAYTAAAMEEAAAEGTDGRSKRSRRPRALGTGAAIADIGAAGSSASAVHTSDLFAPQGALSAALLCFQRLLEALALYGLPPLPNQLASTPPVTDPQIVLRACGEYCESFAAIADASAAPMAVVTHLLAGAMRYYYRAGKGHEALRVGLAAQRTVGTIGCDLQSAAQLSDELCELAASITA
jgi:hypothetical protein